MDTLHFDNSYSVTFAPPEGECTVMHYRVSQQNFVLPFKITTQLQQDIGSKVAVLIRVRKCNNLFLLLTDILQLE